MDSNSYEFLTRLRKLYKRFAYRKETFYLLNYLTLGVKDSDIKREINEYRRRQLDRVCTLFLVLSISIQMMVYNDYFRKKEGHPLMLIVSLLVLFDMAGLKIALTIGRFGVALFFVYNYYFIWLVTTYLVYSGSLPSWLQGKIFYFEWQVLLPYIYVMIFPIH